MEDKIRWGILGLGNIAKKFAEELQLIEGVVLAAVASRNLEKAQIFAGQYRAKHAFGDYQKLFECKEVDVIYIATPHTLHAEQSILAMNHGKHVLCEKPMGINRAEVEKMIRASKKNNVFLMEALWSRFNPSINKVRQGIDQGIIGKVRYIHADFAFYALDRDLEGRVLNPALGGGSILDIGIYPIFLAYFLLGIPQTIMATSNFHENGAEIQTAIIFKYAKAQAILYSGFSSESAMKAEISGSKGSFYLHPRWHEAQGYSLVKDGSHTNFEQPTTGKGYTYEIEEVRDCLKAGKLESVLWSHQNSLDLIQLLDQVRKQTGTVFPFET